MTPVRNTRALFSSIPHGLPIPDITIRCDSEQWIDIGTADLQRGFLIKTLALSLDPYMRNRMRPVDEVGDMDAFPLGEVLTGFGVCVVLRSDDREVHVGEHFQGFIPFQLYSIMPSVSSHDAGLEKLGLRPAANPHNLPWSYFVGVLGMPGRTAFFGLKDISSPQAGETIFVSAAAGAVGQIIVQLAKASGLKVIASVGSKEKVQLVKSLGADHVFNRHETETEVELRQHGPIDIYFDNVGGQTLESVINCANKKARIIICGAVSQYNTNMNEAYGVRNLWLINRHRIKMEGLVVIDWEDKYGEEFDRVIPPLVASGQLRYHEHIYHGLESVGQGLLDLMTGANTGKAVVLLE